MAEKAIRRLIAALLVAAAGPAGAGMTVEQAYQAIAHARTPFEATPSPLPAAEAQAMQRFFALTDQGVVLKAEGMRAHAAGDSAALRQVLQRYEGLAAAIRAEPLPAAVLPARELVATALEMHQRFISSRPAGGLRFTRADLGAADVTGASRRLLDAYGLFMRAYPAATARQKQAFYDHLCALDFL